jgi:hypothetical protein
MKVRSSDAIAFSPALALELSVDARVRTPLESPSRRSVSSGFGFAAFETADCVTLHASAWACVRRLVPLLALLSPARFADPPEHSGALWAEFGWRRFALLWRSIRGFHGRCDAHADSLRLILDMKWKT